MQRVQRRSSRPRIGRVGKRSIQGFIEDDMVTYAAALAYYVFFSLFPFIIFLVALLGFLRLPGFFDWLLGQAQTVLPEQAAGATEQAIGQVRNQSSGGLLSFGIVVALLFASSAVRMAMHALNIAYDVQDRPMWKLYPLSIFYTILLAVLVIVAVGLMLIGPQVATWLAGQIGLDALFVILWTWLHIPVAILLLIIILALVYYLFPNADQPFRFITPGAVLAVIVWLAASLGFAFYVKTFFANYSATYGSLGAIIVLLLYFFISAAVLLLGAEVNAETYHQAEGEQEAPDEERPDITQRQ